MDKKQDANPTALQHAIMEIMKEASALRQKAVTLDEVVKSLRPLCDHDWVDDGVDQRGAMHEKCRFCLLERIRPGLPPSFSIPGVPV